MKASLRFPAFLPCAAVLFLCAAGSLFGQDPAPSLDVVPPRELFASAELPVKASGALLDPAAAGDLPKAFPGSRYSALLEKSPFAVATAAPEAPTPTENFSTNFVVTGIAKNRGADGKEVYTVFVRSRDLSTRLVLTGDKPSDDGVSVVSVEEAAVAAKSVVVLKKGSETGRVEFDHAALASSGGGGGQPAPVAPQAGKPGVPNAKAPTSAVRPAIPRPGTTSVPRPGASLSPQPTAPGGAVPINGAVPGGQELRRRVRPIQGAPGSAPEPQ